MKGKSHELILISAHKSLGIDLGRFSVKPPPVICEIDLILNSEIRLKINFGYNKINFKSYFRI